MTWNRRDVLRGLGLASGSSLLWALGCGAPPRRVRHVSHAGGEVRTWLRDAVAALRGAGFTYAHAVAVSHRHSVAALDVLGAGVGRDASEGVALVVVDPRHGWREHVTSDLSEEGVRAAVRALAGSGTLRPAAIDFGPAPAVPPAPHPDPDALADAALLARVEAIARRDQAASSRIVYAAALVEVDEATVWSVAPGHDLLDRRLRVRKAITRVAWNGTRPTVCEATRAYAGGLDDADLGDDEIAAARNAALALTTPGAFPDGEHTLLLDPSVAAALIDVAVRGMLTTHAARRPEVARRAANATPLPAMIGLVDDPTAPGAYGGFAFDDEGAPATPRTLISHGQVEGLLADRAGVAAGLARQAGRGRRPGHLGRVIPAPSHLRAAAGTADAHALVDVGYALEGGTSAVHDPSSDRIVVAVGRARELRGGVPTGRLYADLEIVGELRPLLHSITGASRQTRTLGIRESHVGRPLWRSLETPWLAVRGTVRARRGIG